MQIVTTLVITLILFSILYIAGTAGRQCEGFGSTAIGFTLYLGLLELFGSVFVALRLQKIYFIAIAIAILVLLLVFGLKKEKLIDKLRDNLKECAIGILVTMVLIVITFLLYRSDADDSFYVSNAALFQNSSILNPYDSSFGNTLLGTVPMYDFQVWESLVAIVSSLFHVEAVSMMHTFLLPVLLIASASGYLFLGEVLFDDRKKANIFYMLLSVFHLFGGYAVYSEGSFLLSRLWQGKAVYLTVVLPVMIGTILKQYKKYDKYFWVKLSLCMLAGMALNPTSLYVMGFQMLFLVVVVSCIEQKAGKLLHIIPAVGIVVCYTLLIYMRTSAFSGQIEAASNTEATFVIDTFKNFWGIGWPYFVLYLISIIVILISGTMAAKIYMVFTPMAMALTIWNPYLGRLVAENITKVPSYWRVFWLIPAGISICYAIVLLYDKIKIVKIRYLILIAGLAAVIIPGKWMFSKENLFIAAENTEKLPVETVTFGASILKENRHPVVLGCEDFATTLRQKYCNIELIYSRYQYILDLFYYRNKEEEANERIEMKLFADGEKEDFQGIDAILQKYDVDYIILKANAEKETEYLLNAGWSICEETDNYILLQSFREEK